LTALRGLDEILQLKRGESLMVFGGRGSIGILAVQLAKRMGAECSRWLRARMAWAGETNLGRTPWRTPKDDVEARACIRAWRSDAALVKAGGEAADSGVARHGRKRARGASRRRRTRAQARPGVKVQSFSIEPNPGNRKAQSID